MFTDLIAGQLTDQETKWSAEASLSGLKWIRKTKNNYCLYRFDDCQHEQEITLSSAKLKSFRCKTCQQEKLQSEAKSKGLIYLGKTKNNYGKYKFLSCSHEQEIATANIRQNKFVCQSCCESRFTKPSNLYVHLVTLQGEQVLKVGVAKNIQNRIKVYGLPKDAELTTVLVKSFPTGKDAEIAESLICQAFKNARYKNSKHIFTNSGSTECFAPSKLNEIVNFINTMQLLES
jgi:hypothetical protein